MRTELILEKQDLTYLSWSRIRNSSGTAGSFLKSYSELGGRKIYYKLSNFDNIRGVIGHECVNELIADRLLNILGIDHLHYQLIHADVVINETRFNTYLCASEDFKQPGENKVALDVYYENERQNGETPLDFCIRNGWSEYIYQMFLVDYLILNRDRHGANIEVLRNPGRKSIRLAPLFDHGLSLLFHCLSDASVNAFDVMEDRRVNTYIGSRSVWENLHLIPVEKYPHVSPLRVEDKAAIMGGLDNIIPANLQNRIWEMIWKRWCMYEDFRCSR